MRLRIHQVITRLIVGGAQENTILTSRGLVQRGHDVTLITGPDAGSEGSLLEAARATGARIIVHTHLRRAPSPAHDPLELVALVERFRADRPHVVHTHSSKAGILGRLAARIAGVPAVVHTNHGLPFHEHQPAPVRAVWRALEQVAARLCDRVICVGRDTLERTLTSHIGIRERFAVVRSGMEVERFLDGEADGARMRRELGFTDSAPVAGTVARFAPQKGPHLFLDAATELLRHTPDVGLVWVGDGPLRDRVQREARGRGLNIRFTGVVPPARIPALLAAMDVVIVSSLWEGLPRVAVQAALCGRPVVAFDAPGVREVIEDGANGRVVATGNASALASAAAEILGRPDRGRSMALAARSRIAAQFGWERMVDELERAYVELLSAGR